MKVSSFSGKGYKILISALVLFFLLIFVQYAYVQPPPPPPPPPPLTPYTTSAHGSANGVNRTSLSTFGYSVGNCAHCHEQHAMIGGTEPGPADGTPSPYLLFTENFTNQSVNFCLYCHKGAGSLQVSFDRTNYNYSYWFGGDHVNQVTPNNIYDAFNPAAGSSHNLQDILTFVKTKWPGTFGNESNPCNACHNPHLSKRSFPVVRPTDRNNIWGDSAGEHMSDFASVHGGNYQALCRYPQASCNPVGGPFEPDGSATRDGSNLPDYVTFCSDCHNATNIINSTTLGRQVKYIDWSRMNRTNQPGDYHGSVTRCTDVDGTLTGWGNLKEPYHTANYTNFITSCTDCHEPHGAINGESTTIPFLLRKTVNGFYNYHTDFQPGSPNPWEHQFCLSCHNHNAHCGMDAGGCMTWSGLGIDCHTHNSHTPCYGAVPCSLMGPGGYGQGHTF